MPVFPVTLDKHKVLVGTCFVARHKWAVGGWLELYYFSHGVGVWFGFSFSLI
jgi:hypothetical protein